MKSGRGAPSSGFSEGGLASGPVGISCARCGKPKLSLDAQRVCVVCRSKEVCIAYPPDWTENSPEHGKQLELF